MNTQKDFIRILLVVLLYSLLSLSAIAGGNRSGLHTNSHYTHEPSADEMAIDAVLIRPIGLVTTVAGTAIYAISLPFSLLGGNEQQARENLVYEPARFTFKRPLGEFSY